jgi:hypothetical protein
MTGISEKLRPIGNHYNIMTIFKTKHILSSLMRIRPERNLQYARFEILREVVMKSSMFLDIMLCSPLKVNQHFRGTCRLHLQGRRICQQRNQHETRWQAEPDIRQESD